MVRVATSPNRIARAAGLFYLGNAALFALAESIRARVLAPDDPLRLTESVRASAMLVRLSLIADLFAAASLLVAAILLFRLLGSVNPTAAAAMLAFAAILAGVGSLNLLNQYAALAIATDPAYVGAMGAGPSTALVLLFASLERAGFFVSGMFAGLWLLPLGYLVMNSRFFPRVLGPLLIVACFSWVGQEVIGLLTPGARFSVLQSLGGIGEVVFVVWLLVRGAGEPHAPATA